MKMKQRILLSGSFAPSLITFRGHLICDMVAAGHEVHVCAPNIEKELSEQLIEMSATPHSVPLQRTGLNIKADLQYLRSLRQLIRRIKPDLVLNYTIKPNIWGGRAAHAEGVSSVSMVTGLGYSFIEGKGLMRLVVGRLSRHLYRRSTSVNSHVVFQNPSDRDDFIRAGCLTDSSKACIVNGSGVDLEAFAPVALPEKPVFLLIARLLISKGVREYAEAAIKVMGTRDDCRFLLAGGLDEGLDGIGQEELDSWVESGIEFLGWLDDVRPALKQCSVYVLPSYREGTPRTVLEAMSMGRPVIVSDAPGCRDTVKDGETGVLVKVRDAASLAMAMSRLADNWQMRDEMGRNGRYYCEAKYGVHEVNQALMDFIGL